MPSTSRTAATSWSGVGNIGATAAVAGEQQRAGEALRARARGGSAASTAARSSCGRVARRAAGTARSYPTSTTSPTRDRRRRRGRPPTMPRTRKSPCPCSSTYSSIATPSCSPRTASDLLVLGQLGDRVLGLLERRAAGELEDASRPRTRVTVIGRPDRAAALRHQRVHREVAAEHHADGAAVVRRGRRRAAACRRRASCRWRGRRRAAGRASASCECVDEAVDRERPRVGEQHADDVVVAALRHAEDGDGVGRAQHLEVERAHRHRGQRWRPRR